MSEWAAESYVVRIYRRDQADPALVAGIVEVIADGSTHRFHDLQTLTGILAHVPEAHTKPATRGTAR